MLLHGFLRGIIYNTKHCPVKLKTAYPICILMWILAITQIAHSVNFKECKAVFSTPCGEVMTLNTAVPNLTEFTICTYLKLLSQEPWTAFIYKLPSSPDNGYEMGVFGDNSSMQIWMFGTEIIETEKLNPNTWYQICIMWNGRTKSMEFYLDGTLKLKQIMENNTQLEGNGNLILGCPNVKDVNASSALGLVGDLYMFRMWNTTASSFNQMCDDGNVVKWSMDDWIYSPSVMQQDLSLNCAKGAAETPTGQNNNNIHLFNKRFRRAVNASLLAISDTNNVTSNSSIMTSISSTGYSVTTNLNNGTYTYSHSSTSTTTSISENIDTVSSVLSSGTYSTSDFWSTTSFVSSNETNFTPSASTVESMNCSFNGSTEIQHWLMDTWNSSCNGSVYDITFTANCNETFDTIKAYLNSTNIQIKDFSYLIPSNSQINNLSYSNSSDSLINNQSDCMVLLYTVNYSTALICSKLNQFNNVSINISKIDYCFCAECSLSQCIIRNTSVCDGNGGSGNTGGSFTPGLKTTTIKGPNIDVTVRQSSPDSGIVTMDKTGTSTFINSSTKSNSQPATNINTGSSTTDDRRSSTINNLTTVTKEYISTESSRTHYSAGYNWTSNSHTTSSSYNGSEAALIGFLKSLNDLLTSGNLNSSSLDYIVSYMEQLLAGEVNPEVASTLVGILNTCLNVSQSLLTNVSERLIKIVDKIGLQLTFPGQSINLTSQSLALAVDKVNASFFNGTSFGIESSSDLQVSLGSPASSNSDGSILLPASLLSGLSPSDQNIASRIQFNYFAKTSFFMDPSLKANQSVVSKVISSSVANITVANLKENVTVTLKTFPMNVTNFTLTCVFWDFTKNNGRGGWASDGCTVTSMAMDKNETVCSCNHLTSFAILMDVTPNNPLDPENTLILTFITYIGCGLSSIFLSVTLVTYIAFEKIRRDYPSKILIQLCAALVCLNLTFLLDPWIALYNDIPGLCISVAAFLHYFVLVSMTWMGLEAFHMYLSLVKVFNTYVRKYMLKFCIIGWGGPAVVVAIILAVKKDLYKLQMSATYPNGSADYFCWMEDIIFWITVVGFFGIIFLLNVSMFVVVLIQLCRIKKQKQLGYQRKTTLQDLRSVAGITFLLGITWGLGFFSFGPGKVAIMYLFTIFNTLQGFFIFLFYCVAKENVRKQWRRYLCCGKFRLAENSDWSKTATNKLKNQTSKQGVSSSSSNSIQSTSNSNSTTLLVANDYSLHPNGNGNAFKERNGISFQLPNGEMPLQEFPGRPSARNGDAKRTSLRRTSNRGSVHFIDQI